MVCQVPSPVQILFIDRLLKGDKGEPGTSGSGGESVQAHEAMYDHGDLHEHNNLGLLQSFTYTPDAGLFIDGRSAYPTREVWLSYNTYSWVQNSGDVWTLLTTPHEVLLGYIPPGAKDFVASIPAEALTDPNLSIPWFPGGSPGRFVWAGVVIHGAVTSTPDTPSSVLSVGKIFGFNLFIQTGWTFAPYGDPPSGYTG